MLDVLIIGGGISGLTVAHASGLYETSGRCELWECTGRLGGTIGTDRLQGYSVDWGPNGFLDREPLTLQLVDEIGLRAQLEPANPKSEKRFIAKHGQLHPVPFSPFKIVATRLLRPLEKARIFCEPFIPARRDDGDESVFDFAARRIGRGAAETFVDPMVSGVHGGLARELSLPSCFPVMREMEVRYGSLVKGLIARQIAKRRATNAAGTPQKKSGGPAGPGGHLTSFKSGFDVMVQRLEDRMQPIIRKSRQVMGIRRNETGWEVSDQTGLVVQSRNLVVACPAYSAALFMKDFDSELSAALAAIPYAPIIVVATGHKREDIGNPLDGFGFLIPRNQGLRTLGSIWTSSIFSERAPEGFVQFRSMLGGDGDHSVLELSDGQLWEILRKELDSLIGIRQDPAFMRIFRWEHGIPQFKLGHRERRARTEQLAARHPGLYLTGNAYYGVGLNDCVKMAYRIAQQISKQ
jgi:protoporphyrinogen/coproporphyrinogen III oxidase